MNNTDTKHREMGIGARKWVFMNTACGGFLSKAASVSVRFLPWCWLLRCCSLILCNPNTVLLSVLSALCLLSVLQLVSQLVPQPCWRVPVTCTCEDQTQQIGKTSPYNPNNSLCSAISLETRQVRYAGFAWKPRCCFWGSIGEMFPDFVCCLLLSICPGATPWSVSLNQITEKPKRAWRLSGWQSLGEHWQTMVCRLWKMFAFDSFSQEACQSDNLMSTDCLQHSCKTCFYSAVK